MTSQRFLMRVLAPLRGISASLRLAAKRSSIGASRFMIRAFSSARFLLSRATMWRRCSFFSMELFFAICFLQVSAYEPGYQAGLTAGKGS